MCLHVAYQCPIGLAARLLRWNPDKAPRQCKLDQMERRKANLMALLK
jgi:hypothetical protein